MPWANKEKRREYSRKYYANNKEKWRGQRSHWTPERWRKHAEYMREYVLKRDYGIDRKTYDEMAAKQGGVCAICHCEPNGKGGLHVDHCHATGKVRSLLCAKCNMALGYYENYMEQFESYLNKWRNQNSRQ